MRVSIRRRAAIGLIAISTLLAGCGVLDPTAVTGGQLNDLLEGLITSFEDGSDLSSGTEGFTEQPIPSTGMAFGGG